MIDRGRMTFEGVLFFPVTPFDPAGGIDDGVLATHVRQGVDAGAGAVFAGCGTGEFHALTPDEMERCARVAVTATTGRVPVYAGAGGPLPTAVDQVRRLARTGVDGVLLLPPYLVGGPQAGVVDYVRQVAAATDLPVVFYQRGNAVLTPRAAVEVAALPTVVGIKDGVGDLELMHRIVLAIRQAVGPGFQFFNGLPTAEMTVPAYRGVGVPLYSSAVFAFAPEIALAYYRAVTGGDHALRDALLARFYAPLVELRDERAGYPVALIKAGVRLRGLDVGGVRAPFTDPAPEHVERLALLLATGLEVVRG
jgi:5-dehydro-4-deoxyglucarate dehydratase